MTREEAIKGFKNVKEQMFGKSPFTEALDMAIQALSQAPCDECKNNHTSICGNCDDFDEFEEIDFVQPHKKIPVTLDLTPCDDAISREIKIGDEVYVHGYVDEIRKDIMIIRNEGGYFSGYKSEVVKKLPSVTQKSGKWINMESEDKE